MGYRLNRLVEPVFMAVPKPMLTDVGIHYRLESYALLWQPVPDFLARHFVSSLGRTDKIFLNLLYFPVAVVCTKEILRSCTMFWSTTLRWNGLKSKMCCLGPRGLRWTATSGVNTLWFLSFYFIFTKDIFNLISVQIFGLGMAANLSTTAISSNGQETVSCS